MKKFLIFIFLILFSVGSVWSSEFEKTKESAEQGDSFSQYYLASMYDFGIGVPQDYKKALYWYTKAAKQGDFGAQYNLGVMYLDGIGVPQDYKKALYWYTKSAEQGYFGAQYNLGVMYLDGTGVPQDYKLAYVWESLAASQGYKDAINNRDFIYKKLSPKQLSEAKKLVSKIQYEIQYKIDKSN